MASVPGDIERILEQAVAQVEKQKEGRRADAWADVFANKNKSNNNNNNRSTEEDQKGQKRDREREDELTPRSSGGDDGEPSKISRQGATASVKARGDGDRGGGESGRSKQRQSDLSAAPSNTDVVAQQQQKHFSDGDLQDRTTPVCSRRDYVTAYTVEVGKFRSDYCELKAKLSDELRRGSRAAKKDLKTCDISLEPLLPCKVTSSGDPTASTSKQMEKTTNGTTTNNNNNNNKDKDPLPTEAAATTAVETEASTSRGGRMDLLEAVQPDDTILRIGVFHPAKPTRKMQEIVVLGSQKLTVLKDKVVCQRDEIAKNKGLKVPSSFFFINGVFYNDMRDKEAIQYSDEVMQFIKHKQSQKNYKYGNSGGVTKKEEQQHQNDYQFSTQRMEDTSFNGLDLKLGGGCPYVYCHQGCCEHRLAFLDLRLVHPELDRKLVSDYPYVSYQKFERRHRCMVCGIYEGKFVTYEDVKATCSPCVFCDECYHFLHTGQDGKPLYGCKVFEYPSGVPKET